MRDTAEERAFAGVRFANEAYVGNHFQLKCKASRFALFTAREFAGSLIRGGLVACVAFAPFATAGRDHLLAGRREIFEHEIVDVIRHNRAGRHVNH